MFVLQPFWSLLSSILQQVLSPGDNSSQNTNEEEISDGSLTTNKLLNRGVKEHWELRCFSVFIVQSDFTCNDPDHFCWWLVAKVAPLYWFNDGHVYAVRRKGSKPGNWVFITELLKSSLSSLKSGQEEYHRRFYLRCCLAVSCHWSANTGIVVWLWEYFHKRLNELFNIPSHTLHGMTTVNLTVTQWMEQCAGRCQDHLSSLDQENSFSLLLRIIAVHLNKIQLSGSQQGWKQMKGRFYSKFTKKRMEELSETGTRHFLNLFLTLSYIAADLEDVATKMCHFLDLLDFSSESPGKKVLIVKGLFTLMLIYKERNMDFAYLSNKMSTMFWLVCKEFSPEKQVRDKRQLWDLVMVYLDGTQEILEHKNKHDLSEFKLIESPGFKYLFEGCRGNELQHLLMFVQSVLALVRPLQDNTAVSSKQEMSGYLWSNMFPYLQKLLSRDRTIMMPLSTILADTMAGFTLLALERYPDTVNRSVSFKNLMSDYGIKDELPASFVCRFLGHVITARDAEMVIEAESLQSQVIHAWFRCLLQLPTNEESCFTLSRAVAQLPEMASLIKNQEGFGLSENSETTLKQFIMALASHYQSLTTFEQIIQFRTRAQLYFGNVEKYIEVFINTGKPQDSLRLAFSLCGSMFKYCYKIIYSKSIQLCLLPKLLDQLILPLHTNKVLPVVQQHASRYLHMFLQGLSQLDFRKDEFIKRKIRKILDNYFHKSLMTTSPPATVNNPFMAVLKDSLEKEPTKESSDFRQFCISYISEEFFQLPQPPQKLNVTLHFMVDLFKRTQSLQQIARNTEALLVPILGCLLACETSQPGNEPPNIRRQATDILRMMIDSSKQDENYKSILSPLLKTFVANNLQKCQGQVFATLKPLTVLDPPLITGLIPDFKQSMMQSETSRGVGTDNQLRKAFHNLLKHLGQGE
ncbi:Protein MMS22-like [Exaiptasia diaphana]|nr:Protein MMS22-like [Exaiptasia diaphana]